MVPFLLPLILYMYGEHSKGYETRYVSRMLFYAYLLSIVLPLYVASTNIGVVIAVGCLIFGIGNAILVAPSYLSKLFFFVSLSSAVINYSSIYLDNFDFLLSLPYYADYSNYIFRESLIIGIAMTSIKEKVHGKDFKLEMYVSMLWMLERFCVLTS